MLSTEGANVELRTVQILDMNNGLILEEHLRLMDKKEQFYITESIDTPNQMFKIAVMQTTLYLFLISSQIHITCNFII